MRPVQLGRQPSQEVTMEEISTKKKVAMKALIDSGYTWTCVDKAFVQEQNWSLKLIRNLIPIEYADGTVTEASKIRYTINLRIKAVGAMVLTRALVTWLKTFKVFLGFDWLQAVNLAIDWQQMKVSVLERRVPLEMWWAEDHSPVLSYVKLYPEVFSEVLFNSLPHRTLWDHQINLIEGAKPPWGRCYPLSHSEQEALDLCIKTNVDAGKIRPSMSPYASAFFFHWKLNTEELCRIQDYRRLNKITIKDHYPLPLIGEVISWVTNSSCFSKMDLRWGFNNVQIQEGDEEKAAFITLAELFEPLVMQFGLCNTPSTFQWMVDKILQEERESGHVEVYISDILIHTLNLESNCYWTGRVLAKLGENQLFCWEEKCQFEQGLIEFLGMEVTAGKVGVSQRKVKAIQKEVSPKTKKGVQQFLGLTNYHCWFMKDYLKVARPLHDLTKDVPFQWDEHCEEAFNSLKDTLSTSPILALPRDNGKFHLETDASDVATGAVLSQQQPDRTYQLLGCASKSISETGQGYTTYDKELLGIMHALEEWWNLLIRAREPFEIFTDHWNLTYFRDPQMLMGRQVNWTTKLQDFGFTIHHVSGELNERADALSRPEGAEKVSAKTGTVLPDHFFAHYLSGDDAMEDTEWTGHAQEIADCHDPLMVGHPHKENFGSPSEERKKVARHVTRHTEVRPRLHHMPEGKTESWNASEPITPITYSRSTMGSSIMGYNQTITREQNI
jgi:hypothetical protein